MLNVWVTYKLTNKKIGKKSIWKIVVLAGCIVDYLIFWLTYPSSSFRFSRFLRELFFIYYSRHFRKTLKEDDG